jgi:hypothetical protein
MQHTRLLKQSQINKEILLNGHFRNQPLFLYEQVLTVQQVGKMCGG